MFTGRYTHKLDAKGRLALPSKMREAGIGLQYSQFVVSKGIDGCIAVFPVDKFEKFIDEFDPSELEMEQGLNFYREFASWAHYLPVDNQGRINIPQTLLDIASIDSDVLILGVVDWIEIWNPDEYEKHLKDSKVNYNKGAKTFFSAAIRGKRKKYEIPPKRSDLEDS
ncbi:division/cell wall cluster transcriptional repressor MraZ [bacterium]|nr:division/cell wall cluster transcriptional repressor MraZ [bacterium]